MERKREKKTGRSRTERFREKAREGERDPKERKREKRE